ncbi:MAG: MarR family transcriptional regulator [Leptospirales bacterium]
MNLQNESIGKWISILHRYALVYVGKKRIKYDINPGHLPLLMTLMHRDSLNQEEISQLLFVDKGTTSKIIKQLVDLGYIQKKISPEDRRIHIISKTKKLKSIENILEKTSADLSALVMAGFTEKEKKTTIKLLKKIAANVIDYKEKEK